MSKGIILDISMRTFVLRIWTKCTPPPIRSCYFSTEQRPRARTIEVLIGGNGNVEIEILSPRTALTTSKLLVYLPPGTLESRHARDSISNSTQTPAIISSLYPDSTIISLNYRLSPPTHIFPLPIHETAVAFNHILRTFANLASPQISLLGSRIGGTLATTLALTNPSSIHSVAVSEPIVDWVSLDSGSESRSESDPESLSTTGKKTRSNHYSSADAKSLLTLRSRLFPKPDTYFDPFASPTLFLRAPGRDCPQPYHDPLEATGGAEAFGPYDDETHIRSHSSASSTTGEEADEVALRPIKRRKVLRRWPPNAAPGSVQLPHFRVFVGDDQKGEGMVLRQQGEELVEVMRKVCFYGVEREVVEERVGLEVLCGREKGGSMLGVEEGARWLARKHEEDG